MQRFYTTMLTTIGILCFALSIVLTPSPAYAIGGKKCGDVSCGSCVGRPENQKCQGNVCTCYCDANGDCLQ